MQFLLDVLSGAVTGIITGFGIGGGTLLILYLTMFRGVAQITAQGINLLYFIPAAGCAIISHIKHRRIVWRVFRYVATAGMITTVAAAFVVDFIDITVLKRIFGGFLTVVGMSELFRKTNSRKM